MLSDQTKSESYNKLSIIGFALAILGGILFLANYIELGFLIWLPAVIIEVVAIRQINKLGGKGKWFAIIAFLIPLIPIGIVLLNITLSVFGII